MAKTKRRSIVYIDGFNLYYGAIKDTPHKWLNLQQYFQMLRPDDEFVEIKYFTALMNGPPRERQQVYLRALETLPLVTIILGSFKPKQILCKHTGCTFDGPKLYNGKEEKRTDVSIGVHFLNDAYCKAADNQIIVSGDSDLIPALNMTKLLFPKLRVVVYVPARDRIRGAAVELRSAADQDRLLPLNLFPRAQFPGEIPDGAGGSISKPAEW